MVWQKFSDRARECKKIRRASSDAVVLWWAAGNYCSEHETDGFFPKEDLPDIWRPIGRPFDYAAVAAECVSRGLLIDHVTHYEVHDYLHYNPSKERLREKRRLNQSRVEAYRERKKTLEKLGIESYEPTSDVTHDVMHDVTHDTEHVSRACNAVVMVPRPVPTRSEEEILTSAASSLSKHDNRARAPEAAAAAEIQTDPDESERVLAARGRKRLADVAPLVLDYDHGGRWQRALAELSRKPEPEWAIAATTLAQVATKPRARRYLTPQHVLVYWAAYSSGETPGKNRSDDRKLQQEEQEREAARHPMRRLLT